VEADIAVASDDMWLIDYAVGGYIGWDAQVPLTP